MSKKPLISNLSVSFRKSVKVNEDVEEAKLEHRESLRTLTDQYFQDVKDGKVPGIRHARDLIEIMKLDLVLMGEADNISANADEYTETRMTQLNNAIDENDPNIQDIMDELMQNLNDMNDGEDVVNRGVKTTTATEDAENEEEEE